MVLFQTGEFHFWERYPSKYFSLQAIATGGVKYRLQFIKLLVLKSSSARIYQFSAIRSVARDRDFHQLADLPGLGRK